MPAHQWQDQTHRRVLFQEEGRQMKTAMLLFYLFSSMTDKEEGRQMKTTVLLFYLFSSMTDK
ncbi:hypothetical protein HanRHA438_Chr12g0542461 [Helianthus annuus]|nr:hypothetical protein HanRHA438_Chr12g0542461 [Helianthus annuus]